MKIKNVLILSLFIITAASGCIQEQVQPPVTTQAPQSDVKTTVRIKNFVFDPTPLAIKAGTPVEWVNDDSVPHRIEFENFASRNLNKLDAFDHKFETKGTYDYVCGIHPSMKGMIVVE